MTNASDSTGPRRGISRSRRHLGTDFMPATQRQHRRIVVVGLAAILTAIVVAFAPEAPVSLSEWSCHEWLHRFAFNVAKAFR